MKIILILGLLFVTSTVFADGFRCEGERYSAGIYNYTKPKKGTKNPAVLYVYENKIGTIATIRGNKILKETREKTVNFEGLANHEISGRYVYVVLSVAKKAQESGSLEGSHLGKLSLSQNNNSITEKLICERYIKSER